MQFFIKLMKYPKLLEASDRMLYLIGKKRNFLLRNTVNSYKQ